jgi:CheY-like chemotaxis protein
MSKAKILVVDDDPDLVRALRLRLRANNYDVTTASDGYAAIAQAQKERPALIILDLGLPVGDGFVVLDRLQTSDALSGVPVIVLSARDPQTNEERALKAGAAAFFSEARRQRGTHERDSSESWHGGRIAAAHRGLAVLVPAEYHFTSPVIFGPCALRAEDLPSSGWNGGVSSFSGAPISVRPVGGCILRDPA